MARQLREEIFLRLPLLDFFFCFSKCKPFLLSIGSVAALALFSFLKIFIILNIRDSVLFEHNMAWGRRNKKVKDRYVNGGEGGEPLVCNQTSFIFKKRKRCRMLWNGKICILFKKEKRNIFICTCFTFFSIFLDLLKNMSKNGKKINIFFLLQKSFYAFPS